MILIQVTKKDNPLETIAFNPEEVKTLEGVSSNLHSKISLKDGREIVTWESFNQVMAKMKKAMAKLNGES